VPERERLVAAGKTEATEWIEAVIDEQGSIRLLEPARLPAGRRALVTILEYEPLTNIPETALLSEPALAEHWNRSQEDEAWSHLQQVQSS